jgi:hypothetical protein
MEELTAQPQANEPAVNTAPTETPAEETTQPKIKVKYNKEEKELTYEEAVTYAQKGMNYDHVYGELQDLRNDEALKIADDLAKQYGISRVDLLKKWKADVEATAVQEYAEEKGMTPEAAREVLEARQIKEARKAEKKQQEEAEARQKIIDAQEEEFHKAFPDVKNNEVPEEVLADWANGIPLLKAYKAYLTSDYEARLKKMEEEKAVKQANEENAASSMGSVEGNPSAPFKVTEEWIKKASQKEYEAHKDEIRDWYFKRKQSK